MEKRRIGSTDMQASVLGFGGAEVGFEGASGTTVEQILLDCCLFQGLKRDRYGRVLHGQ